MDGVSPPAQETPDALVAPLAGALAPLAELAYNLWWTWNRRARALFEGIDPALWAGSGHNPVKMLLGLGSQRTARLAGDREFMARLREVHAEMQADLRAPAWYSRSAGEPGETRPDESRRAFKAAYFCAEFGLAECMQSYSGGLGLLAGDHLKSASCLGLPLVAVGLLYKHGYFHQALDDEGRQEELYPPLKAAQQPIRRVIDPATRTQRRVSVDLPGRRVHIAIWRIDVGRVPLYLLDTDVTDNDPRDRDITRNLYLGDHDTRIRQEIILGIGGVRALAAMGEDPTVCHMNEGHSAFLALERTRRVREALGVSFDQAREATAAGHIFTTHTPVPAGIDRFAPSLVSHYFSGYHASLGLDLEGFLALGRENVADPSESFSMAVLAIRTSRWCNGVSRLHGKVSRGMWRNIWPGTPQEDVPIGHVTNGVLTPGWVGPRIAELLTGAMGDAWRSWPQDAAAWDRIGSIPDGALWEARRAARLDLIEWCRGPARDRLSPGPDEPGAALAPGAGVAVTDVLDPSVLTIGFARRFAAYKRGTLLLRNPERLLALLRSPTPVQVIMSGKAHPGDSGGKLLIKDIVQFARTHRVQDRLVFIEDYDIEVARRMVQGCDIWLNTPIRGLEASGTSGMKAAANGVINVSTLDGWWDEAFAPDVGYHIESIGTFDHDLPNEQREHFESDALYRLLEHQLVPEFYERDGGEGTGEAGGGGVPRKWVARMKRCIRELAPRFSTHRMVAEYAQKFYFPAHDAHVRLAADGLAGARALSDHLDRYRANWSRVRVIGVQSEPSHGRTVYDVSAVVELEGMEHGEVAVQLRHGQLDAQGELVQSQTIAMAHEKDLHNGAHRFVVRFAPSRSPRAAWVVRVLPGDPALIGPFIPGLIVSSTIQRAEAHVHEHE